MLHLIFAAALASAPSPTPAPPVIVNESVSPLCGALRENVRRSVEAELADDQAIAASKPVFAAMAHDFMSSSITSQIGLGNLNASASIDHDTPSMQLDAQRIEEIVGALTHNLQRIDAVLSDPKRFPAQAKTESDRKLLELKAELQAVEAQQRQTLNFLSAVVDERNMDALSGRGNPAEVFGIDDMGKGTQFQNAKVDGANQQFTGGPLTQTPAQQYDPALKPSEFNALTNSVFGRFYRIVFLEQQRISSLETPLAKSLVEAGRRCTPAR